MNNPTKDTTFTFRTNSELMDKAKKVVKDNNFDMSYILNALLIKVVESQEIPVELLETSISNSNPKTKEEIIDGLFAEIDKGYQSFLNGNQGKSVEEVFSKYGL